MDELRSKYHLVVDENIDLTEQLATLEVEKTQWEMEKTAWEAKKKAWEAEKKEMQAQLAKYHAS